jgi:hypothetical protein
VEDAGVQAAAVTQELSAPPAEVTEPPSQSAGHAWAVPEEGAVPVVEEPTKPQIRGSVSVTPPGTAEVLLEDEPVAALSAAPDAIPDRPQTQPPGTLTRAAGEVSVVPPVEIRRSNLYPLVAVVAVLVVGAMITMVLIMRPQAPLPLLTAATPVPDAARAAPPDRSRTAGDSGRRQATVLVRLRLAPASARVLLDGLSREDNPLSLSPSEDKHVLRVEAKGYTPREITFVATADLSLDVALQKQSVRKPPTEVALKKSVERSRRPATGSRRVAPSPTTTKTTKTKKRLKLYDDI